MFEYILVSNLKFISLIFCTFSTFQEHKLDVKVMLEVYENNMIQFMSPQDHQDDFFVPEATEAELAEHRNQ